MTEFDLTRTTRSSTNLASRPRPRRRAAGRRARSASSPGSRRSSGSSRSTAAPRSTARTATSSSGSMPCASTACARWRNAGRCSSRWIIRACWPARDAALPVAVDDDRRRRAAGRARRRRHGADDITELRHVRISAEKRAAEEIANRTEVRGLRRVQAAVRAGAEGPRRRHPPDPPLRAQGRDRSRAASSSSAARTPMSPTWARRSSTSTARPTPLRVIYDNGTESNVLHALASDARFTRTRPGGASPSPSAGPLFADESEEGDQASGTIYVLRSKSDHPDRRGQPRRAAQDRRDRRRRAAPRSPTRGSIRPS